MNGKMKNSIRTKLFIGVSGLTLLFVFVSVVLNSFYLEKYYVSKKKNTLIEIAQEIDDIYKGSREDIETNLDAYLVKTEVRVKIFNQEDVLKRVLPTKKVQRDFGVINQTRFLALQKELLVKKAVFNSSQLPNTNMQILSLLYLLNNKDILLLTIPLATISENAGIANEFFLITGLLIVVIGISVAYMLSRKFTSPILEINDITKEMAKLDFSKKCQRYSDDEIGELAHNINYLSDQLHFSISQLNEKNKKLLREVEKEKQIDEMRKEFISNVSHELKTPISLIQGYAEGLQFNVNKDEENRNFYCEVIIDEAVKMDKMVKDLLNLSKLELGYFEREKSIFDLGKLVDDVLRKFNNFFAEKEINLEFIKKEKEALVYGDPLGIEQVLLNYLNNALHHVEGEKVIRISVARQNDKLRISVYNTGEWIPKDSRDKIWLSFYKVDKARTRAYGGTGLGLSIVKGIMDIHNNRCGADNVEDGVVFWFELDACNEITYN